MSERFELTINSNGQADIIDRVESKEKNAICIYNDLGVLPYSSAKAVCDKLNEQEETIQELLKYKYLVKALEEVSGSHYIEEIISDYSDGAVSDEKEQLELGKWHSEHGLSWEEVR